MRSSRWAPVAIVVLLSASAAHAQFANKRLGIEAGVLAFKDSEITFGLMAILEGSYYIENGFEVGLRVPFGAMLTNVASKQRFATGGQLYVRYLISEEALRPYVGVEIDVLGIIRDADPNHPDQQQNVFWGPGATAGLDYFVGDTVSIGLRPFFTLYIGLNNSIPIRPGYGGNFDFHFYF